jgi:hypothetical protein
MMGQTRMIITDKLSNAYAKFYSPSEHLAVDDESILGQRKAKCNTTTHVIEVSLEE